MKIYVNGLSKATVLLVSGDKSDIFKCRSENALFLLQKDNVWN